MTTKKILKFSAAWCGPCKTLTKTLADICASLPIENIDIDENTQLTQQFKVRGVPTLIMLNSDGVEIKRIVGLSTRNQLESWIND